MKDHCLSSCFKKLSRFYMGIWLLYVGAGKWMMGPAAFQGYIVSTFEKTWIPAPLVMLSAWIIMIAEPLIGAWLISGRRPKKAWFATTALFFLLLMGQTVLQQHQTVFQIWVYLMFALVCFGMHSDDCCGSSSCSTEGEKKSGGCCS